VVNPGETVLTPFMGVGSEVYGDERRRGSERRRGGRQVGDMKTLLKQGVPLRSLIERLGFTSQQRMVNAFREVVFKCATKWLAEERKKDPKIPEQPKRPGQRGRRPGTPTPEDVKEKIGASVRAQWASRGTKLKPPKAPPPKGPQPVLSGAALAAIRRGALAFDEHQRRMAAEREATTAPPPAVPRETKPSRERGEARPIDPRFIHVVDNTPTLVTVFDRFLD
jgi:hypothetical protein